MNPSPPSSTTKKRSVTPSIEASIDVLPPVRSVITSDSKSFRGLAFFLPSCSRFGSANPWVYAVHEAISAETRILFSVDQSFWVAHNLGFGEENRGRLVC